MITEKEIAARLGKLHSDLAVKLEAQPWIEPIIHITGNRSVSVTIYGPRRDGGMGKDLKSCFETTFAEVLAAAEAFVADMPDPYVTRRRDWHRKLGDVINEGRELALPDDVMGPIRQGSQAMAKNLLTSETKE